VLTLLGPASDYDLSASVSQIAEITGRHHHTQIIYCLSFASPFCLFKRILLLGRDVFVLFNEAYKFLKE
jgi:hypothetical protein